MMFCVETAIIAAHEGGCDTGLPKDAVIPQQNLGKQSTVRIPGYLQNKSMTERSQYFYRRCVTADVDIGKRFRSVHLHLPVAV